MQTLRSWSQAPVPPPHQKSAAACPPTIQATHTSKASKLASDYTKREEKRFPIAHLRAPLEGGHILTCKGQRESRLKPFVTANCYRWKAYTEWPPEISAHTPATRRSMQVNESRTRQVLHPNLSMLSNRLTLHLRFFYSNHIRSVPQTKIPAPSFFCHHRRQSFKNKENDR